MAYSYPFRMSSNTATMLVIDKNPDDLLMSKVCIGIRGRGVEVHPGQPSLPGGFMEAKLSEAQIGWMAKLWTKLKVSMKVPEVHAGETLEETALRELLEETCTVFTEDQLVQYHTCSTPGLDPRAHVVNLCFYLEATPEQVASITPGDDLEEIQWWTVLDCLEYYHDIAFNHLDLMHLGLQAWIKEERFKAYEAKYGRS